MITNPDLVVAELRYPIRVDGLTKVMRGLCKIYGAADLVIVTDGPLWRDGWMTVARRTIEQNAQPRPSSSASNGPAGLSILHGLTPACQAGEHHACQSRDGEWSTCACECHEVQV